MQLSAEPMAPWLLAAFLLAALNLVVIVIGHDLEPIEHALLLVGLCGTVVAAGLVATRSHRHISDSDREERARPASEELTDSVVALGSTRYAEGMARWTGAVLELIDHALDAAGEDSDAHDDLAAAAADTRELNELLATSAGDELRINDAAMIHAVCTLWEANQPRIEELAAAVDPVWHRRWRARSVADRRLRHGGAGSRPLVLPYRS